MGQAAAALAAFFLIGAQAGAPPAQVGPAPAPASPPAGGMETDLHYDASVAHPAYAAQHPRILFDAAHRNYHLPDGRYRPFAELIRNDGYRIETNERAFSAEALAGHDVLVIANAQGAQGSEGLVAELKDHVVKKIGAIARPDDVIFSADLPKTRSGKIMRRLLRDIAEGKALGDTTTLADPAVVARLKEQYEDEH